MTNPVTANFNIAKPNPSNDISFDVVKLAEAFDTIDAAMKVISDALGTRAPVSHTHSMAQIEGLLNALAGKMNANQSFSLDSLNDVDGATLAAVGQVLVKAANGQWNPSSPLAALGNHGHTIAQVTNLQSVLDGKADAASYFRLGTPLEMWTALGGGGNNAANGFFRLPNGAIVQWGTAFQPGANDFTLNWGVSFPNAIRMAVAMPLYNALGSNETSTVTLANLGVNNCSCRPRYLLAGGTLSNTSGMPIAWIAIGS